MKILDIKDFSGGYCTDVPYEEMADNELLVAENCIWKKGLTKRGSVSSVNSPGWASYVGAKGGIRAKINGTWYFIIALDDDTDVNFYYGTSTTLTAINASYGFTKANNVEFAILGDYVIAVNGVDKPAVIYYDSGWVVEDLEALDIRTRDIANWYAGQWTTGAFVDDTTDAQDAGTDDFQVALNATNNDGFYISCDYIFNKITLTSCQAFTGSPVAEYAYWNGSSWTTITPSTVPTWTAAEGDKTIEFDLPFDSDNNLLWERYDEDESVTGIENRFVFRVRFTTAPTNTPSCDSVSVYCSQYLTLVLSNEKPQAVCVHNNQLFFACGNIVNFSPYGTITGWNEGQAQYVLGGGNTIQQMVSYNNSLVILKDNSIFLYNTTDLTDPVLSPAIANIGTPSKRSACVIGNVLGFVGKDGIYIFNGNTVINVSDHIRSDFKQFTLTNACSVAFEDEMTIAFPTDLIALQFNPNSFRRDKYGNGRVSFFKYGNFSIHLFISCFGYDDTGRLHGLYDKSSPELMRIYLTEEISGVAGTSAYTMTIQTKYFNLSSFQKIFCANRLKVKTKKVAASSASTLTITIYGEDGVASKEVVLTIPIGTGYYSEDISIPYEIDGKNISIKVSTSTSYYKTTLLGFAISLSERRF